MAMFSVCYGFSDAELQRLASYSEILHVVILELFLAHLLLFIVYQGLALKLFVYSQIAWTLGD